MKRFVLNCEPYGVYLGISVAAQRMVWACTGEELAGTGRAGLVSSAVTWSGWDEVKKNFGDTLPTQAKLVEVECAVSDCATVGECVKAGLRMWNCYCPGEC